MGQADLDLLPADHDCPAHGDRKFVRTARRYRTIEIQVGPHTITAADPLPDDLHHAIETIARVADLRTNLAQLGSMASWGRTAGAPMRSLRLIRSHSASTSGWSASRIVPGSLMNLLSACRSRSAGPLVPGPAAAACGDRWAGLPALARRCARACP